MEKISDKEIERLIKVKKEQKELQRELKELKKKIKSSKETLEEIERLKAEDETICISPEEAEQMSIDDLEKELVRRKKMANINWREGAAKNSISEAETQLRQLELYSDCIEFYAELNAREYHKISVWVHEESRQIMLVSYYHGGSKEIIKEKSDYVYGFIAEILDDIMVNINDLQSDKTTTTLLNFLCEEDQEKLILALKNIKKRTR